MRAAALGLALELWAVDAVCQELEPRAFSPAPLGTTFFLTGFGWSRGAYVVDAAAPIQDAQADISFALIAGGYTFSVAGHQARVLAAIPYAWGGITGNVGGEQRSRALEGFGDARIKLSIGLINAPALTVEEFARAPKRTIMGASLTIMAPIGQYDSTRLINLGFNRWALKPEIGVWYPAGRWTFDGSAGVWFFGANESYFPSHAKREQDPLIALQGHVSYDFPNGTWFALDAAWFAGGQTQVEGIARQDRQQNLRFGATLSLPMSARQSLKLTYITGLATRRGADFETLGITYQLVTF